MSLVEEKLSTPVVDSADVLVVGGGVAGVAAAVAARRQGADVMILEKTALFGGLATNGLISWYEPLCDGQGTQLMHGLPEELLRLSVQYGPDTLPEIWKDRSVPVDKSRVSPKKQHRIGGRYATHYSPTMFQLAIDELLVREGVRIRLCTGGVRPVMEGNRCAGVITESISGRQAFTARMVIDATGDAIILSRAGVPCVEGQNYFSFVAHEMDAAATENILSRRRWHSIGANLYGGGHPEELPLVSGTTAQEETDFLLRGRLCLLEEIRGHDHMKYDITALPHQAQFRKTRRLAGAYTLTEAVRNMRQERSVGLLCDFDNPGNWYELPFECLYHPGFDNLLAAGRMISSDGWAWDVTRVIPACAASGAAAGIAAALALRKEASLALMEIQTLQERIRKAGVLLHREDA